MHCWMFMFLKRFDILKVTFEKLGLIYYKLCISFEISRALPEFQDFESLNYLRFEILRASWLMLTSQTVNTDSSVGYNNNIVAHNKSPADVSNYRTRDYDRTDKTQVSNSADPRLTLRDQISLGYTATTEIRDWGISVCIDIIIKSISPRIMSHTQSPLRSFSPVIIGLLIPPGFILCDCFFHQSLTNAR